jgi:hypothetical protein
VVDYHQAYTYIIINISQYIAEYVNKMDLFLSFFEEFVKIMKIIKLYNVYIYKTCVYIAYKTGIYI